LRNEICPKFVSNPPGQLVYDLPGSGKIKKLGVACKE
jgi:hypothetical protein